ncbi:hypothetical protein F5Y03DRAFT_342922 [Xylaria venustula]|nr:hypothetical protein F5Y03DRAFT_342922 [Xylaria venustula]
MELLELLLLPYYAGFIVLSWAYLRYTAHTKYGVVLIIIQVVLAYLRCRYGVLDMNCSTGSQASQVSQVMWISILL